MSYIETNLIGFGGNMNLAVDSLTELNSITTCSNNITFRNVNVKPYEFKEIYMYKNLIEDKLYQIIDKFNETKLYV